MKRSKKKIETSLPFLAQMSVYDVSGVGQKSDKCKNLPNTLRSGKIALLGEIKFVGQL